ncbi:MAG: flagellar assembly protein FliH [Chromatiaceae bacterium]|nr:flagellar assembly protein FliH [Chromatiaceae bacterium]
MAERWLPPDVGDPPAAREPEPEPEPQPRLPTAAEIEAIEQEAREAGYAAGRESGEKEGYEAGFESGYKEGHALGYREAESEARARADKVLRETVEALEGVARDLADPLGAMVDDLEPDLLALVVAMARRVILAELETRPELVSRVLHEALAELPSRRHEVRVRINPEDASVLRDYGRAQEASIHWIEDEEVARGGCRVESGPSQIDASLETRLSHAVDAIWGQHQSPPESPPPEPSRPDPPQPEPAPRPPEASARPGAEDKTARAAQREPPGPMDEAGVMESEAGDPQAADVEAEAPESSPEVAPSTPRRNDTEPPDPPPDLPDERSGPAVESTP